MKGTLTAWLIKIFVLTFSLSLVFSSLSEMLFRASGVVIAVAIIIFFLLIQFITDIIANAVTVCDDGCFKQMCEQKLKGAKQAAFLVRNKDKVASFLCDIIGDVCGILSGAAGATIVVKIAREGQGGLAILYAALIAATIASLTVVGKAAGKTYAKRNSEKITLKIGKFLAVFAKNDKKSAKKKGK